MTPNQYQSAIYHEVASSDNNIVVRAVAGSGKTTTIVEASRFLPQNSRFFAFNKNIAEELSRRLPPHVSASTFHSFCFDAVRRAFPHIKVDAAKTFKYLRKRADAEVIDNDGAFLARIISLMKSQGVCTPLNTFDPVTAILHICDEHAIEPSFYTLEELLPLITTTYTEILKDTDTIDFDDMLLYPIIYNIPFVEIPAVIIDEAQDTNDIQTEIVRRIGGRLIAVGDARQAIYGFRGANSTAMSRIKRAFAAKALPLSVCYRCAKAVVAEAQKVEPSILPAESAPQGSVVELDTFDDWSNFAGAVICRNNAPLFDLAYKLLRRSIPYTFRGRDIVRTLQSTIKRVDGNSTTIASFRHKLDEWFDKQKKTPGIVDRYETLCAICDKLSPSSHISTIQKMLQQLTSEQNAKITLSTIHQAKGLEWDNVIIYRPDLMPSRFAKRPWQLQQEENLRYVAITRARQSLTYVASS